MEGQALDPPVPRELDRHGVPDDLLAAGAVEGHVDAHGRRRR